MLIFDCKTDVAPSQLLTFHILFMLHVRPSGTWSGK